MRVISGKLGGQIFKAPSGHATHPMGDRVRTALFNTLGDIEGLTILDAFGGSGALSFEAISRGASKAKILETDKLAYKIIQDNIDKLKLNNQVELMNINANSWTYRNNTERFDILLFDPPYDRIQEKLIEKLAKHANVNGIIVTSIPTDGDIRLPKEKYQILTEKVFGNAKLVFYRKIQ